MPTINKEKPGVKLEVKQKIKHLNISPKGLTEAINRDRLSRIRPT
jgi:hypothetical protein